MKYFKDKNNEVWAYEDEVKDEQIANGLISITETEFNAIVNPPLTQEQIIAQMITDGESIIIAHIQKPIDDYNATNGTAFAHAHTCANYKDETGYTHQAFCQQAWSFNVTVWEAGRAIQTDVLAGTIPAPTAEEFKAMLPVFGA
jgi:hypothetical protein